MRYSKILATLAVGGVVASYGFAAPAQKPKPVPTFPQLVERVEQLEKQVDELNFIARKQLGNAPKDAKGQALAPEVKAGMDIAKLEKDWGTKRRMMEKSRNLYLISSDTGRNYLVVLDQNGTVTSAREWQPVGDAE